MFTISKAVDIFISSLEKTYIFLSLLSRILQRKIRSAIFVFLKEKSKTPSERIKFVSRKIYLLTKRCNSVLEQQFKKIYECLNVKGINPFQIKLFPVINFFLQEIIYEIDITTCMFNTDQALIYSVPDDITLILKKISRHCEAYSNKDHYLVFNPIG